MKANISYILLFLSVTYSAFAYHILVVFPVPSRSHNHLAKGIVDALLKAGHKVTWVSPYTDNKPEKNLAVIEVSATQALLNGMDMTKPGNDDISRVKDFAKNITLITLENRQLKEALVKQQFDAVVTEWFFSDVHTGFAAVLQVPWILVSSVGMHPHMEYLVDDIKSTSTVPLMMTDFPIPMNFWQRLTNTFILNSMFVQTIFEQSKNAAQYEALFGPLAAARGVPLPPYSSALHNVSILFVNSHPSIAPAMSVPPNVIDIAGYHIDDNIPPLPKDLQDLLDSSPQGVVYFSMGSVLRSANLPKETQKELVEVLGELPQTVLWKYEQKLEDLPKNVHIRPWMPQASILAHPNVKVFITHGGLLSNLEAINCGVPLLAIPMFGDQHSNAARAVRSGYAQKIQFSDNVAKDLKEALKEMLGNNSYRDKVKHLSNLFRNRPLPPKKLLAHYVELAIETKGAYHLRSPARFYSLIQLKMWDQLAFILTVILILYIALKTIIRKMCGKRGNTEKKQKVKKN